MIKLPSIKLNLDSLRQHRFFSDGWIGGLLLINVALNSFVVIWSIIHVHRSDILVPIRYTSLANFDTLGHWYQLYFIAAASVIIFIVNATLGVVGYRRSRMTSIFLLLVSAMVAALAIAIILGFTAVNYGAS